MINNFLGIKWLLFLIFILNINSLLFSQIQNDIVRSSGTVECITDLQN